MHDAQGVEVKGTPHMGPDGFVRVLRGGEVESLHRVHAVVCDARGAVVSSVGDPSFTTFLRSSAKPFQAAAVVLSGAAERFSMTDEELALVCASHSGEPGHVALAEGLLARAGFTADALQCGTLPPAHKPSAKALVGPPSALHHVCSGKHAGMLAACVALGADPSLYLRPDHPVQRLALRTLATFAGVDERAVGVGVDGCGVPTFRLPLRAAATAFARLARPASLPPAERAAAERVLDAMAAHPWHVAGSGRIDTALMEAADGRLVSKSGAEGFHAVVDRETGLGLATKVEDGASRAAHPALVEACRQLGWIDGRALEVLGEEWRPAVRNVAGAVVGSIEPTFELQRAGAK